MRLAIYSNNQVSSLAVTREIKSALLAKGQDIIFDDQNPDVVISVGGDGTLLGAFHAYSNQLAHVRFIAVHTGHLGFYSDWQKDEVQAMVDSLLATPGKTVTYPLLEVTLHETDGQVIRELALNEAVIKRSMGTLVADVYINGELFERFRGDGLAAATPTGSTGYNKSIGGAVVQPSLAVIQLSEIASLNNRVYRTLGSPLIVGPNETIKIVPAHEDGNEIISFDQLSQPSKHIKWLELRVAPEKIAFAEYRHLEFWHRVKSSFIGPEVD
ncbi:inorganic polyphosphate/ATP-NAD kinase [Weissella oryzae SG25]|uniref:NAD kinase n=1 Tax=Weissella oryzae (strain DSM 25784 / JCM 18191 / LMG 30913 / SG25) TaxID=1329250 RepID=A0A069D1N6_WEIOS|nr:NAD kinase [Weissella oryzae]GAK31256.1 inorganic polyphosphate/ATP-NAD kinase [Weissella oryzae SG25]